MVLPDFRPGNVAALVVGIGFAAGLNVYATVLALGLMSRLHWVALPPGLEMLGDAWVVGICALLFLVELIADKIPGFDLIWNVAHTFIRVPAAALLAYRASMQLSPEMQLLVTVVGGVVALLAHTSKIGARALVTPSPEPVSNIVLSAGEDVAAFGLTWVATHHPLTGAAIVAVVVIATIAAARSISQRVSRLWRRGLRTAPTAEVTER